MSNVDQKPLGLVLINHSSPNRLMVDESPSDDNSVAVLHPNTMEALGLFRYVQLSWPLFTGVQTLTQAQRRHDHW